MSLGERLRSLLNKLELSQTSLARMIGTSNVVINRYIKNKTTPDYSFLKKINSAYNVNINWLLTGNGPIFTGDNIREIRGRQYYNLPIVAAVSCGTPEEIEIAEPQDYVLIDSFSLPGDFKDYFAFLANGDSMDPYISHGDVVVVKHHDHGDMVNDRICVVRVDGDVTLKKVKLFSEGKEILLSPFNTKYSPILINQDSTVDTKLIGIAIMAVKNL